MKGVTCQGKLLDVAGQAGSPISNGNASLSTARKGLTRDGRSGYCLDAKKVAARSVVFQYGVAASVTRIISSRCHVQAPITSLTSSCYAPHATTLRATRLWKNGRGRHHG